MTVDITIWKFAKVQKSYLFKHFQQPATEVDILPAAMNVENKNA